MPYVCMCLVNLPFLVRKFVEQNEIFIKINRMNVITVVSNAAIARQPAVAFQKLSKYAHHCVFILYIKHTSASAAVVLYILHAIYCIVSMNFSTRIKH